MIDEPKTTKIIDFGFRIEISTSRPGQIDLQDGARLFSIVAWPGKPIFGSKIRKRMKNIDFSPKILPNCCFRKLFLLT